MTIPMLMSWCPNQDPPSPCDPCGRHCLWNAVSGGDPVRYWIDPSSSEFTPSTNPTLVTWHYHIPQDMAPLGLCSKDNLLIYFPAWPGSGAFHGQGYYQPQIINFISEPGVPNCTLTIPGGSWTGPCPGSSGTFPDCFPNGLGSTAHGGNGDPWYAGGDAGYHDQLPAAGVDFTLTLQTDLGWFQYPTETGFRIYINPIVPAAVRRRIRVPLVGRSL